MPATERFMMRMGRVSLFEELLQSSVGGWALNHLRAGV